MCLKVVKLLEISILKKWTKSLNNIYKGAYIKPITSLIVNSFKCTLAFPANNSLFIVNNKSLQQGVKYA